MDTTQVAEMAGIQPVLLRAWFMRGLARRQPDEMPEANGLPSRIGPESAGLIIAMAALVRIGFTPTAASALIYAGKA